MLSHFLTSLKKGCSHLKNNNSLCLGISGLFHRSVLCYYFNFFFHLFFFFMYLFFFFLSFIFFITLMHSKEADAMANSVDPDQTASSEAV